LREICRKREIEKAYKGLFLVNTVGSSPSSARDN
jgi:hypothetical protein